MNNIIITVDGRVCSGKSSIIKKLQKWLSYSYKRYVPHYSCGEHYRKVLKNSIPNDKVDDAMVAYLSDIYRNKDIAIIDGRSSGFALKTEIAKKTNTKIISILLDVNKIEQIERIKKRQSTVFSEDVRNALERDRRDKERCFNRYGKDIFKKENYDIYLDTTQYNIDDNFKILTEVLRKELNLPNKKTFLLFAEESETTLSNKMLNRQDIEPIYLRFSKNFNFSKEYLEKTKNKLSFTVNENLPFEKETERFKKWILETNINLKHFCNDSEFLLEKSHKFAQALSLPSLKEEQALWVRDKVRMKEKLREIGLSVMDFSSVNSYEEIIKFAKDKEFPIMFKRRKGFSSIDAYKLSSKDDIYKLPVNLKENSFMVESFNNDSEWIIDALVQKGKVLDTFVSFVPVSPLWAVVENKINTHITTPNTPDFFSFNPKDMMQKLVNGMQLEDGYIHMETFINEKGDPTICEFGWRTAGCKIPEDHSMAYGFDIYNTLLDIHIGKTVHLEYSDRKKCVGDLYLPNKPGIINKITPIEDLLSHKGVIGGEMFVSQGTFVKPRRAGNEASGYVHVQGQTIQDVEEKMHKILDNFNIETKNIITKDFER